MKLRLPLFLLSFILSIPAAMPAAAAIGAGVSYDVGKGSEPYSKNEEAHTIPGQAGADTLYCWAASASNMIQYWQDTYKDKLKPETPNGFNLKDGQPKYDQPDGTRYLNVYEYILEHSLNDENGIQPNLFNWFYKQDDIESWFGGNILSSNEKEFLNGGKDDAPNVATVTPEVSLIDLQSTLDGVYAYKGQSVGLSLYQQNPEDVLASRYHTVTCWGYGTDADGKIDSLFLTDSDDMEFGVFKLNLSIGTVHFDDYEYDALILQTDDMLDGYHGFNVSIVEMYTVTPEAGSGYSKYAETATPLPKLASEQDATKVEVLSANTVVQGAVERTGAGVKVGVGLHEGAPDIVMLVSEPTEGKYSSLTLLGGQEMDPMEGTGLDVTQGSLASVSNLTVSGYERGVEAQGKVYLYGDTVEVSDNGGVNAGAGIYNANYLEIKDSGSVQISRNYVMEKGAGIYNEDVVSISGNGEVVFDSNFAISGGNDIYNAAEASLNIADNGRVLFSGMNYTLSAVENDGDMYVKSGQDQVASVEFRDSALDSSEGTTYVGSDINGKTSATTMVFTETDWETGAELARLEITGGENGLAAEIKKLTVNAHEIAGVGTNASSLGNAQIRTNNPLAISKLTMNTTDSIVSTSLGDVALDTVVFDLRQAQRTESGVVDLTQMLTGNYTFENVEFLMGDLTEDELKNLTFDISSAYNDAEKTLGIVLRSSKEATQPVVLDRNNVTFAFERVPEPTTGTLSLLALAALAARRRRKG